MDPNGPIAKRFPLVARFRPACLPLSARVEALVELADRGERQNDQGLASAVYNQAALLASDLGLPDLAREMCHQHANAYLHACPLPAMSAIRGLEPLVNLARLHIRTGRTDDGRQRLLALYEAVTAGESAVLEGIAVPADPPVHHAHHGQAGTALQQPGPRLRTRSGGPPGRAARRSLGRAAHQRQSDPGQPCAPCADDAGVTETRPLTFGR